jgi:DNA-binding IclR family transcriptional regulator
MESTSLTVHMAILEQHEAVIVEKIEPPGMVKLPTWVGKRMDLHCTGVGKALMAYFSSSW